MSQQTLPANSLAFLHDPVFCFTSDIDWAPEEMISEMLKFFEETRVPVTPFVTHESKVIREHFWQGDKSIRVGVHPNFLPLSTHGHTQSEVIDAVQRLWPQAISFRSHIFFDNSEITEAFWQRGFRYDSNLCLFLQPNCVPLQHSSGMVRFPVFWEDDVHLTKGFSMDLNTIEEHLDTPGLKVFNVHPFHFALNSANRGYYTAHKHLYQSNDPRSWRDHVFAKKGTRTFVEDSIDFIKQKGYRTKYLYDLFLEATRKAPEGVGPQHDSGTPERDTRTRGKSTLTWYRAASEEDRVDIVREIYDKRDPEQIYATSRDFNLRELEISFIAAHIPRGNVLDIGCGNGYTIISLAKRMRSMFIGVDFSSRMVEGAIKLTRKLSRELECIPQFGVADIRDLPFENGSFDCVISERSLLNLPSRRDQYNTIQEIHRVLRDRGVCIMVEGTEDGLSRLNDVRHRVGLDAIPSVSSDNVSSLKFRENELERFLRELFEIDKVQFFGTYYLISRVVHPLLVYPNSPSFDAKINTIARRVAEVVPDVGRLGHIVGYKLIARKKAAGRPKPPRVSRSKQSSKSTG